MLEPVNPTLDPVARRWFTSLHWPIRSSLKPKCRCNASTPKAAGDLRWLQCDACNKIGDVVNVKRAARR